MLRHAHIAIAMGVGRDKVLLCEDGDVVELSDSGLEYDGDVPAGYLFVDGVVGDVGHAVLRDRRMLAEEGVVVIVLGVDAHTGEILTGPEIITRGWVGAPGVEQAHRRGAARRRPRRSPTRSRAGHGTPTRCGVAYAGLADGSSRSALAASR